jgi:hypothetical protein
MSMEKVQILSCSVQFSESPASGPADEKLTIPQVVKLGRRARPV